VKDTLGMLVEAKIMVESDDLDTDSLLQLLDDIETAVMQFEETLNAEVAA
jgi:hypothetical protein